jgi:hypothetical protein
MDPHLAEPKLRLLSLQPAPPSSQQQQQQQLQTFFNFLYFFPKLKLDTVKSKKRLKIN